MNPSHNIQLKSYVYRREFYNNTERAIFKRVGLCEG